MPQLVEVPGLGTVEFPDGTSQDVMRNAIQKELAKREAPQRPQDTSGNIADSLGQGISLGFSDELAGVLGAAVGTFDPRLKNTTFGERFRGIRDAARENQKAFAGRNPGTDLAAQIGGGLLTGGVGLARGVGQQAVKQGLKQTAKVGAGTGALGGVGFSEKEDVAGIAQDAAIGGLLGAGISSAIPGLQSAIKAGARPVASKAHKKAVGLLSKENIPLTTGQVTNSKPIKTLENTLGGGAILGSELNKKMIDQRKAFQSSLMKRAGFADASIATGEITQESFDNAAERFTQRYTEALKNKTVNLSTDSFKNKLNAVQSKHEQLLPFQQKRQVKQVVEDLKKIGTLTGEEYQQKRSLIAGLERTQPTLKNLYADLKKSLDDSFIQAVDEKTAVNKLQIDREYARFKQMEKVFQNNGGAATADGFLPLASLNRSAKKSPGQKEWKELINSGSQVLGDSTPNSGTTSRALDPALLTAGALTTFSNPLQAGVLVSAPLALSRGLSRGVGSKTILGTGEALRRGGLLAVPATAPVQEEAQFGLLSGLQ